jgi:hypothetical protein
MALRIAQFLAVIFTALALVPAGAHLAALPGKIGLARDEYFAVQGIYIGWAWFGIVQAGAILSAAALAFLARGSGMPFTLSLVGSVLLIATMVLFFIFVFPANQATSNWTQMPENWEQLRTRWEYTHALNAILTFLALVALTLAVIVDGRAS